MPCTKGSGNAPTTAGILPATSGWVLIEPDAVAAVHVQLVQRLVGEDAVDEHALRAAGVAIGLQDLRQPARLGNALGGAARPPIRRRSPASP